MTLAAPWTLAKDAKVKYLPTLVCGEALRQFDSLSADMEGTNPLIVENIILGLASYFFPTNSIWKQKHVMQCGMSKLRRLKVRRYMASLIDMNE